MTSENSRRLAWIGWLLSCCYFLANLCYHTCWFDEMQGWALVDGSRSILQVWHHTHFEGHPILWHLSLWPFTLLPSADLGLKSASFVLGVLSLGLLWMKSPFGTVEKILLTTSFQMGYVLTVASRPYNEGVLFTLLFLAWLDRRRGALWQGWLILGLLANVQVYFSVTSFCLAAWWVLGSEEPQRTLRTVWVYLVFVFVCSVSALRAFVPVGHTFGRGWLYAIPPILVYLGLLGLVRFRSLVVERREAPMLLGLCLGLSLAGLLRWSPQPLLKDVLSLPMTIGTLGRGLLPVVNPLQSEYWALDLPVYPALALGVIAAGLAAWYFWPQPLMAFGLVVQAGSLVLISTYAHSIYSWHVGVLFMLMVAAVWYCRSHSLSLGPSWLLWVFLISQGLVGLNAAVRSKFVPLSEAPAVMMWLKEEGLQPSEVMIYPTFPTNVIPMRWRHPVYSVGLKAETTFVAVPIEEAPKDLTSEELCVAVLGHLQEAGLSRAYLILPVDLAEDFQRAAGAPSSGLRARLVQKFTGSIRENFAVFEVGG